jgi:hypothetical protein
MASVTKNRLRGGCGGESVVMKLWKWFLVISAAAIFVQIVLAGLMFMGFGYLHTVFGHLIFFPILVTLILAWRQKAGRRALGFIGIIFGLDLVQAEPLAHFAKLSGLDLATTNVALLAHGINALVLYTLTLSVTVWALRRPEAKASATAQVEGRTEVVTSG